MQDKRVPSHIWPGLQVGVVQTAVHHFSGTKQKRYWGVSQILYSHTEGIALIDWIEFPPWHAMRPEGRNQLMTCEIIYNLPQTGQYTLRPDDRVLSC